MAPFRSRGRGGFQGGRGGGGGGGGGRGGRGGIRKPSEKLARSGIRTRAGYRKFDSQRVKDVESEDSEDGEMQAGEKSDGDPSSEDEEISEDEEVRPAVKAYSALMQSFSQPVEDGERRRKRRRIEVDQPAMDESEQIDGGDVEPDVEEDGDGEEAAQGGDAHLMSDDDEDSDDDDEEEEEQEEDDTSDPFEAHLAGIDEAERSRRIKAIEANEWRTDKQPVSTTANFAVSAPKTVSGNITRKPTIRNPDGVPLKKRLADAAKKHVPIFDQDQQTMAPYLFNYNDVMLATRTPANAESLRSLACLHALNHVLKGRDRVLKNTAKLAQADTPEALDLRDQGFTCPKVLVLTEHRQMAARYGDCIAKFFQPDQQENKQRFHDSFTAPIDDGSTMPEDYRELFDGNNDNSFLTAIKFTRKTMRYFSAFYASDIILASPLGLRRIIENEDKKKQDWDFLSSIELLIIDQADAMQLQNIENLQIVLAHLNLQPRDSHDTDFSRVRPFYLDGHAKYLRQTVVFTAYLTPELSHLYNKSMLNITGKAKLTPLYAGAITHPSLAPLSLKQTFTRFSSTTPLTDPDDRFAYFTQAVLPSLLRLPKPPDNAQGILLFIPTYFDFLRVRNFFATSPLTENISFGAIHDYSSIPDQRRARSHFLSGRYSILLYTQRAHHFFRLKIRGIKRVVMYGVPDHAVFYEEIVGGFLGTSVAEGRVGTAECAVRALFSRWDSLRLERVVGSARVKGMLGGVGDTFEFV
ncbi:Utp25 [Teratosphaeria destructans]|uniref:U3 small nucleolar RNA-associated protein 25 n=1 Tax=Teratosphaeria destructans TaxID=418781 RepID=A0A9W7SY02_9PEZI|nr:Utp25 [Teratosphaeria destructans]